jgi:hypothetical protein
MINAIFWYTGLVFWSFVAAAILAFLAVLANDRRVKSAMSDADRPNNQTRSRPRMRQL